MKATRRLVPLLLGIVAAVAIAGVAAFALPGASDASSPAVRSVEATAHAVGVVPVSDVPAKAAPTKKAPPTSTVDTAKLAAARDSFPTVPKADRVAAKLAAKEADETRKAEEEAARLRAEEKAKAEADAQAAAKADQKDQQDNQKGEEKDGKAEKPKDEEEHGKPKDEDKEATKPEWWPEHVWGHAVSCTVTDGGASVVGNWDVWLKYGGDWAFVSASPDPSEVSGTDGDKVKLTYRDMAAVLHKEHDGKAKYRGGPIQVTVQAAGDPASTRTFTVDLWVVADADRSCPS